MFATPSPGFGPTDPNAVRAIEHLSVLLSDVEQKVQMIRMSLGQHTLAWPTPGVSPTPYGTLSSPLSLTPQPSSVSALLANPIIQQQLLANPIVQQQLLAISATLQGTPGVPSAFGVHNTATPFFGTPGVNATGFGLFQAPVAPFRF